MRRHPHPLALGLCLLLASPVVAQERRNPLERLRERLRAELRHTVDLLRAESGIERRMVTGHVRGLLSRKPDAPDWSPREAAGGRLEVGPGGVPILHLRGTPEQMGRQHGLLLKGELEGLVRYARDFVGAAELPAAKRRARELFERHVPPRYLREVTALAEAAELPVGDVLFSQWFTDLYRSFACTTYSAPSAEGRFLARNLDFPGMGYLAQYSVVVVARPAGQRPFVSVTWPGLVGVLSGQNETLALSVMVVHNAEGARSGLPFQLAFRQALEETDTVAEAEAYLRSVPLTVTNNLMLADRAGEARLLELHPDGIVGRDPDPSGKLVATNHFLTRQRRERRASITYLSSRLRLRQARDVGPQGGEDFTVEHGRQAMRAAGVNFTQQSMVFLPARGAVEVAFAAKPPATDRGFVRLEARHLLQAE
jgi:predicted choloylglycine hydrolase